MQTIPPRLMATFVSELQERSETLERELLALEDATNEAERSGIVTRLFREAHSLKGAAGAVGFDEIASLSHRLEDALSVPATISVDDLLQIVDALRTCGNRVSGNGEAAERSAPHEASGNGKRTVHETETHLRVPAEKLDSLLRQTGELVIAHHRMELRYVEILSLTDTVRAFKDRRLRSLEHALDRLSTAISADRAYLERSARRVDAEVRNVRMLPFSVACEGIERIVRDASHDLEKNVRLEIHGEAIEIDRAILEGLHDPLVHLVRNAVVHGIELPQRRAEIGKPAEGTVRIKAQLRGNGVEVTIEDDGAGLDRESIAESARERGFLLNEIDIGGAIFLPGLSTSKNVTALSGRGIGLDAVRSRIESLRGTVTVHSLPGKGTSFTLLLPLTLSTLRALLFDVSGHRFAIESSAVERVVRPKESEVVTAEGRRRLLWSGSAVALVDATELFGMEHAADNRQDAAGTALLLKDALGRVALWVDAVLEEREVVVGPLGPRMTGARSALGATILADGSIAVIVRANYAVEHALSNVRNAPSTPPAPKQTPRRKHILLVEDSITTRTLERSILEAAGYVVTTAGDGEEAWRRLAETSVDLVVCDVDMPRMDGFGLTGLVRRSERLRDLPIILVTGRTSDRDRLRGLELGANAYITKSSFDQAELIKMIGELL